MFFRREQYFELTYKITNKGSLKIVLNVEPE